MTQRELTEAFVREDKTTIERRVDELSSDLSIPEDFDGEWDNLLIALICLD